MGDRMSMLDEIASSWMHGDDTEVHHDPNTYVVEYGEAVEITLESKPRRKRTSVKTRHRRGAESLWRNDRSGTMKTRAEKRMGE
jgi:hypothetical protein